MPFSKRLPFTDNLPSGGYSNTFGLIVSLPLRVLLTAGQGTSPFGRLVERYNIIDIIRDEKTFFIIGFLLLLLQPIPRGN